jgi:hypothetical protein
MTRAVGRWVIHSMFLTLLLVQTVRGKSNLGFACHPCVDSHSMHDCGGGPCFGPCGMDKDWSKMKCNSCMLNCHEKLMQTTCQTECSSFNVKMAVHVRKSCSSCQSENRRRCNWGECTKACQKGAIPCGTCVKKCTDRECLDSCAKDKFAWGHPQAAQKKESQPALAKEDPAKKSFLCSLVSEFCR